MSNSNKARELVEAFSTGSSKVLDYVSDKEYIQHNLSFPDGKSAIHGFFADKPTGIDIAVHRVFEDGGLVVVHSTYGGVWNDNQPQIVFDVFRFEDGLTVEHWDNLENEAPPNLSGHTEVDGPTQPSDHAKTDENKAIARKFVDTVLLQEDYSGLDQFFHGNDYINHNPGAADGVTGLNDALAAMTRAGLTMKYDSIHQIIGEGDLVLSLCEGSLGGAHKSFYDLWRIEGGKVAEHWDVVADIPEKSEWNNENGKF
ncbi:MAG: nuclear transport factor 2 family protein [Candidatus Thiodiazotropha sp. (ex Lucinoma borealis)]|nr:nuclear transport factor 2 family protein [Candidatus Thiodiazotropha sp. (ex Lucinoma borealis)]